MRIAQQGGVYVDTDFECIRGLDPLHQRHGFYAALSNVGYFEVRSCDAGAGGC